MSVFPAFSQRSRALRLRTFSTSHIWTPGLHTVHSLPQPAAAACCSLPQPAVAAGCSLLQPASACLSLPQALSLPQPASACLSLPQPASACLSLPQPASACLSQLQPVAVCCSLLQPAGPAATACCSHRRRLAECYRLSKLCGVDSEKSY
jgi:hypothetical protein